MDSLFQIILIAALYFFLGIGLWVYSSRNRKIFSGLGIVLLALFILPVTLCVIIEFSRLIKGIEKIVEENEHPSHISS